MSINAHVCWDVHVCVHKIKCIIPFHIWWSKIVRAQAKEFLHDSRIHLFIRRGFKDVSANVLRIPVICAIILYWQCVRARKTNRFSIQTCFDSRDFIAFFWFLKLFLEMLTLIFLVIETEQLNFPVDTKRALIIFILLIPRESHNTFYGWTKTYASLKIQVIFNTQQMLQS